MQQLLQALKQHYPLSVIFLPENFGSKNNHGKKIPANKMCLVEARMK